MQDRHVLDELEGVRVLLVIRRKVRRHLQRAVEHDIERELIGQRRGRPVRGFIPAVVEIKDAGREVHWAREQAGERQDRSVVGRVAAAAGRVVLLSAGALAGHHMRPGAAQPGILNGLVDVEHDLVPREGLDRLLVVAHHVLAVVPLVLGFPALVGMFDLAAEIDIPGLDGRHPEFLVHRESVIHLAFVVRDGASGLVMPDDGDAFRGGVPSDFFDIEIGMGLGEVHVDARAAPPPFPASVPALDQDIRDAVLCAEINISFRVFCGGTMVRARVPSGCAEMHFPPDPDVFLRLDPRDFLELVRLVEVQDQVGRDQLARAVADLKRSPGRDVRGGGFDQDEAVIAAPGRQVGLQGVIAGSGKGHARIVDERGLVEAQEKPIGGFHREGGVDDGRRIDGADGRLLPQVLVMETPVGRNPPSDVVAWKHELSYLVGDLEGVEVRLFGPLIAEADVVVIDTEDDHHAQWLIGDGLDGRPQLVAVVADVLLFAPDLRPGLVERGLLDVDQREILGQ